MIDIETLSTKTNAVILSIGAVKFKHDDPDSDPYDPLYLLPNVDEQMELGRDVMDETVEFWGNVAKNNPAVYEDTFTQEGRVSIKEVLDDINKWLVSGPDRIWGQGYGFDMTIIESLYQDAGRNTPWKFWTVRDSRTFLSLYNIKPGKENTTHLHNALADADVQAKCVQKAYKMLLSGEKPTT
jgi:hypothetical protein